MATKPHTITAREIALGGDKEQEKIVTDQEIEIQKNMSEANKGVSSQVTVTEGLDKNACKISDGNIGEMVNQIVNNTAKKGKTTIKIEIEICHE